MAAERSASSAADSVRQSVTRLVKESHSEGAQRLLAFGKALDAHSQRVDSSAHRVERELIEMRAMSEDAGERLRGEMAAMRRFVTDQTKAYLSASARATADKDALAEELGQAREQNAQLLERLHSLEQTLAVAAPASSVAALASQLHALSAGKAGKEEVQMLLDQVQRPAVAISRLDTGGSTPIKQGGRRGGGADGECAAGLAGGIGGAAGGGGGGGEGGGGGGGGGGGRTSRPRSACGIARIIPGSDFGVVGKDGALYRGQQPPLVTCSCPADSASLPSGTAGLWPSQPAACAHEPSTAAATMTTTTTTTADQRATCGRAPSAAAASAARGGDDAGGSPPLMPRQAAVAPQPSAAACDALLAQCALDGGAAHDVLGTGMRVGGPPSGCRAFVPKQPAGAGMGGGFMGPMQSSLRSANAAGPGRVERRAAGGSWQPQPPSQPRRPRSASTECGGTRGAGPLGAGYAACRDALVALEAELKERRDTIEFVFDGGRAGASGGDGGERLMWLQWIASPSGAGWAFYEPDVTLMPNGDVSTRTAIATQRASLADFLSQVEGRYVGFSHLLRVAHASTTLWQRSPAATGTGAGTGIGARGAGAAPPAASPMPPRAALDPRRPASARTSFQAAEPPLTFAPSAETPTVAAWDDTAGSAMPM